MLLDVKFVNSKSNLKRLLLEPCFYIAALIFNPPIFFSNPIVSGDKTGLYGTFI